MQFDNKEKYSDEDLDEVWEEWVRYVVKYIL